VLRVEAVRAAVVRAVVVGAAVEVRAVVAAGACEVRGADCLSRFLDAAAFFDPLTETALAAAFVREPLGVGVRVGVGVVELWSLMHSLASSLSRAKVGSALELQP
jgi:hypothetical protein